ncbi:glycosyltransferase family 4 protein [Citrobacter sp. TSA-1]|uniref:glycosyltransferase family 4 protein n=1 Tax=Citrobacter sp. TSA-1 TaxID=184912 RepID=UPI000BAE2644|nr:glycosyltransferase family 4 protein [Citrobacter sp. TSA-1]PAX81808.1 glycosyl transferase [Citrobacter sp. TSA-1]QKE22665.1 glycosyltransferase family 4 protein [Citrobacter sp. TSA-1]
MNILYTESSRNIGGQEYQAVAQMVALKQAGHQVMLACRESSGIAEEAAKHGLRVMYIPFRNSLHLPSVCALRRGIRAFCPDIVVCHSGHDSNIVALTRATLPGRTGRFCIIRQKTWLTSKIRTFSLNHLCDAIVVPGRAMKQALEQAGCRRLIRVIPPGFDFDRLYREFSLPLPAHVRHWLNTGDDVPVIVQAGMLRPEKGHDFMLAVLSQMKHEGYRFRWLIAGAGRPEEEEKLRAGIVRRGMADDVLMCGKLTPLAPVWRVASLMVMPSRNESFGMVVAEAAGCGVPVIASNTGGIPEIVQNGLTGTLLPPDNHEAWLEALRSFFNEPEPFSCMAYRAQRDTEMCFDIKHTIQKLLSTGALY